MPWFDDATATVQVQGYADERAADKDIREANKYGWHIKDVSGAFGQLQIGDTLTKVAVCTGVGILFPVNAAGGRLSVTWERSPAIATMIGEEDKANRVKLEYDQAGAALYQAIGKVVDVQSRNTGGPRTSDVAKVFATALLDRSRAAARRADACLRMASEIDELLADYAKAEPTEPPQIDIAARLRGEATTMTVNASADEAAANGMQDFAQVCRDAEEAIRAAQDAAKLVGQGILKIADAERRALTARDDQTRERAEREVAERKTDQQRLDVRRQEIEADRDAKQAALTDASVNLPPIPVY